MRSGSILRGGAYTLLIQGQAIVIQLAIAITLARILGPKNYGIYSFSYALISFLQVMPLNGLDSLLIRYGAHYLAAGKPGKFSGLLRTMRSWALYFSLATSALVLVGVRLPFVHQVGAFSPQVLQAGALLLVSLPLSTYYTAAIRSFDAGVVGQLPSVVIRPWVFFLMILLTTEYFPRELTPNTTILCQGVGVFVAVAVGSILLSRMRPPASNGIPNEFEVAEWRSAILPFALVGGLMLINQQADLIMIGFLGGGVQAGLYRVSAQAANLISLPLTAANIFLAQRVSTFHTTQEISRLKAILKASVRITFAISVTGAMLLVIFGKTILTSVFGPKYLAAYLPMEILAAAQAVNVGFGSVDIILTMTGKQRLAIRGAGTAAVLNVVLCALLIPIWGAAGAAVAAACALLCWNSLMYFFAKRHMGINTAIFGH
ncbi:MAG: oligosaccharide flippase family protein [Steroidobacteraceae bacterium]